MTLYPIPVNFFNEITNLSWCDIKWGVENSLIALDVVIKKAEEKVLSEYYTKAELELSFLIPDDSYVLDDMAALLNELCPKFEDDECLIIKKTWLYIALSWLWMNRENFEDPLGIVESIYANFGYPNEIANFIKYMPPTDGYDPLIHSDRENMNRLMDNWKIYLQKSSLNFKELVNNSL